MVINNKELRMLNTYMHGTRDPWACCKSIRAALSKQRSRSFSQISDDGLNPPDDLDEERLLLW